MYLGLRTLVPAAHLHIAVGVEHHSTLRLYCSPVQKPSTATFPTPIFACGVNPKSCSLTFKIFHSLSPADLSSAIQRQCNLLAKLDCVPQTYPELPTPEHLFEP